MVYLLGSIWTVLFIQYVIRPVLAANKAKEDQLFEKHYRAFKLAALRAYYPDFRELSLDQLQLRYNVDSWYDAMGRELLVEVRQRKEWERLLEEREH